MQNLNLYKSNFSKTNQNEGLTGSEKFSVLYHSIFDYPLNISEVIKWNTNEKHESNDTQVRYSGGYFFVEGKEGDIYKRLLRQRSSKRKIILAKKAARILSFIPSIQMIGVTGALSMENAEENSDIDLMIVTTNGTLWTTRVLSYLIMKVFGIEVRRPNDKNQKDKLCINIWLNAGNLTWAKKDRNVYTAHEIAQVVPVVNKDKTYEKFIYQNAWIKDFWPNAVRTRPIKSKKEEGYSLITKIIERTAFWLQYQYMKKKISREVVTLNRALFHPQDWGSFVLRRLTS